MCTRLSIIKSPLNKIPIQNKQYVYNIIIRYGRKLEELVGYYDYDLLRFPAGIDLRSVTEYGFFIGQKEWRAKVECRRKPEETGGFPMTIVIPCGHETSNSVR